METFSVVIPVYNRESLIHKTLESVLNQTFDGYEIIIIDDGSTDDTLQVLKSYSGRVRLYKQDNQGPGAARNLGIEKAQGDYISFLDSDDLFFPWTLDVYRQIIHDYDKPAFVAGQPFRFSDIVQVQRAEKQDIKATFFADYYASADAWRWWGVSSFVMRTEALRSVGGFTERPINGEDADLAMRMGAEPGFVDISSGPTFAYRQHGEQLTNSVRKTAEGAAYLVECENNGEYPGGDERRNERWQIAARHVRPASLACLRAGFSSQGWALYWRTWHWHWRLRRWKYLIGFPIRDLQYRFPS